MNPPQSAPAYPVLALRTKHCTCAVPLAHVTEVMRPLPVEPLAGAPVGVCGVAVIRGRVTPVVDLEALLAGGDTVTVRADSARFVALHAGDHTIALLVETVLTVRTLASAELESLPLLWQGPHPPAVAALGVLDRELLIVLESTRLLPNDWSHSANEGEAP